MCVFLLEANLCYSLKDAEWLPVVHLNGDLRVGILPQLLNQLPFPLREREGHPALSGGCFCRQRVLPYFLRACLRECRHLCVTLFFPNKQPLCLGVPIVATGA